MTSTSNAEDARNWNRRIISDEVHSGDLYVIQNPKRNIAARTYLGADEV